MAIQRWEHPAHKLEENNDHGPLVFYSDHLAALAAKDAELAREREVRAQLVEALKDAMGRMHYINATYGHLYGVWFDRVEDKGHAALAAAKELE